MAHDVFISYASEDKITADAVCARLESHRIRCWIAPRDVLPSMDYGQALVEAIKQSRLVVLVFSARSNDSAHVKREVERAVSKGIPILPFRIEDVTPSSSLEFFIAGAHWLDALTPPLERHLERLAETVELLLPRAGTPPVVSQEPEPSTREPAAMSPVLKSLGAAGKGTPALWASGSAPGGAPAALHGGSCREAPTALRVRGCGHWCGHSGCGARLDHATRRRWERG
jgi:hypothetical protein